MMTLNPSDSEAFATPNTKARIVRSLFGNNGAGIAQHHGVSPSVSSLDTMAPFRRLLYLVLWWVIALSNHSHTENSFIR